MTIAEQVSAMERELREARAEVEQLKQCPRDIGECGSCGELFCGDDAKARHERVMEALTDGVVAATYGGISLARYRAAILRTEKGGK